MGQAALQPQIIHHPPVLERPIHDYIPLAQRADRLSAVLTALHSPSPSEAADAASLLTLYATSDRRRQKLLPAIRPLVALLRSPLLSLQVTALTALTNATAPGCRDNAVEVMVCGGLSLAIEKVFAVASDAVCIGAMHLLHNCALNGADIANVLRRLGGIPALVRLLHVGHPHELQQTALSVLTSLTDSADAAAQLLQIGGIALVVSHLASSSQALQWRAAQTLAAATEHSVEIRTEAMQYDAASILVRLLRSSNKNVQRWAVIALGHVCDCEEASRHSEVLGSSEGIGALLALLSSEDTNIRAAAAFAIGRCLAGNSLSLEVLRKYDGVAALLPLLWSPDIMAVQWAVSALSHCCASQYSLGVDAEALRRCGGLTRLLSLLQGGPEELQWRAARLLGECIVTSKSCRADLVRAGGLGLLRSLHQFSDSMYVRVTAGAALRSLQDLFAEDTATPDVVSPSRKQTQRKRTSFLGFDEFLAFLVV
eukprot:TRINITY_DN1442_c0_g1_i1.p1 TRINITY_DN1442_c0_g1~~TRINITY_DN1442_c0_g1_i1.p1  ORF type:complete len:507 (+),score=95.02 TRINITY_DN1442_c0_g1_i1:75-1523(+)